MLRHWLYESDAAPHAELKKGVEGLAELGVLEEEMHAFFHFQAPAWSVAERKG